MNVITTVSYGVTVRLDTTYGWSWVCWKCGWAGLDCGSQSFAHIESRNHVCPARLAGSEADVS